MVEPTETHIRNVHPRAEWLLRGADQHELLDTIDAECIDLGIEEWSAIQERIKEEEK